MFVTLLGIVVFLQPVISVLDSVSIIALQLSRLSYFALPLSTIIEVSEEQCAKGTLPIFVTLLGRVIEVREEHSRKAVFPMLVTLWGMVIEVREEHCQKA